MDENLAKLLEFAAKSDSQVEFFPMDDACSVCHALAGKVFEPREAPIIPVPDCQYDICRCDYLPVVSDDPN